jgi:hypothetical protein
MTQSLATNAYLLVARADNQHQLCTIVQLGQYLQQRGELVFVLSVGARQPIPL